MKYNYAAGVSLTLFVVILGCADEPLGFSQDAAIGLPSPTPQQPPAPTLYRAAFNEGPVRADGDDLLVIAGKGFVATDRVVYQWTPDTTAPLVHPANVPAQSTNVLGVATHVLQDQYALTVRLPGVLAGDRSYALWVVTKGGTWSKDVRINDARPLWISPEVAYERTSRLGLSRVLKVVGRNLAHASNATTQIRLKGPNTYVVSATDDGDPSTASESYVAQITLPTYIQAGIYDVSLSRDGIGWVAVAGQKLTVEVDPPPVPMFPVAAYTGCSADDGLDDAPCVLAAIAAAKAAGGGSVVFGPGKWDIRFYTGATPNYGIIVPLGVNLVGSGVAVTSIERHDTWVAHAVFTLHGKNSISGLRFHDNQHYDATSWWSWFFMLGEHPWANSGPTLIEDVAFSNNVFDRPLLGIVDGGFPIRHLAIANNEFGAVDEGIRLTGNANVLTTNFRIDDSIVAHNTFKPGAYYDPQNGAGTIASGLGASHHVDFSHNVVDGKATEYLDGSPPGWRAGLFFNSQNSHEGTLISNNTLSCTGDKAGDGEAIAFDESGNVPGFLSARSPVSATATTLTVVGPLREATPGFFVGHYLQVGGGSGVGQVRRVVSYIMDPPGTDPAIFKVTFTVSPAWDVIPTKVDSVITLSRQFWQVYVVDNTVDNRGCVNANPVGRGGVIGSGSNLADAVFDSNEQYQTDGIQLSGWYHSPDQFVSGSDTERSQAVLNYFNTVRANRVDGELAYQSDCSWSGIGMYFGNQGTPEVLTVFGLNIHGNTVDHADARVGGAILLLGGTWPDPNSPAVMGNTLVQHNTMTNLDGGAPAGNCGQPIAERIGLHIYTPNIEHTVHYANSYSNVNKPVVDAGTLPL